MARAQPKSVRAKAKTSIAPGKRAIKVIPMECNQPNERKIKKEAELNILGR